MLKQKSAWILVTVLLILESSGFSYQPGDFPNYFEELTRSRSAVHEVRQESNGMISPHSASSQHGDLAHAEYLVEQALFSILRRIQVPHVDGILPDGSPKIVTSHFFEKIEQKAKEKDRGAKVYVSGGVVRSLLGYVYKKLYTAHQKVPPESAEEVLQRIIRGKNKKGEDQEIPSLSALGIGSDLDVLIEPSSISEAQADEIKFEVTQLINSAGNAVGLESIKTKLKNTLVPFGDVHTYSEQIGKSMANGGSTLDWLAFPITPRSGEHMRMPKEHPEIFRKFLKGEYDYLPAPDPQIQPDPNATTIRGLRALLEIPFLHLSEEGRELIKKQLNALIVQVSSGTPLSQGAIEQFKKMMRNARFEGAHNRFYSFDPSHGMSPNREIDALAYQLSNLSERDEKGLPFISEFLINQDPRKRGDEDKCGLKAAGLLMKHQEFLDNYTDHGILYHGTRYIENILSVIRNGLIVSSSQQGQASWGRGTYSTPVKTVAHGYGTPIEFKLKKDVIPRVLNWLNIKNSDEIKKIISEAEKHKIDQFQYLAENCDIDFIVNEHVLIENSGAIQLPKDITQIIHMYGNKVSSIDHLDFSSDFSKQQISDILGIPQEYLGFYNLGKAIGLNDLPKCPEFNSIASKFLSNPLQKVRRQATLDILRINSSPHILSNVPQLKKEILDGIDFKKESNEYIRTSLMSGLNRIEITDPEIHQALARSLKDPSQYVRDSAVRILAESHTNNPEIHLELVQLLGDPDLEFRNETKKALIELVPLSPKVVSSLIQLLKDPEPATRAIAAEVLGHMGNTDAEAHAALIQALNDPSPLVHKSIIIGLGQSKSKDLSVQKYLVQQMDILEEAGTALYQIKPSDPDILEKITEKLKHPLQRVRATAAMILGEAQPKNPAIHQALILALKDPDYHVRSEAARALGKIASTDSNIQHALANALKDEEISVAICAAQALGQIKVIEPSITMELVQALPKSDIPLFYESVGNTLCNIKSNDPAFFKELVKLLHHPADYVREEALKILGKTQPQDPAIHLEIAQKVHDENSAVQDRALEALSLIKPKDPKISHILLNSLFDGQPLSCVKAVKILETYADSDSTITQALVQLLKRPDEKCVIEAVNALGRIKPSDPSVHREIANLLKSPNSLVQHAVLGALALIQSPDPAVHYAIIQAMKNPSPLVRNHTAYVIKKYLPSQQNEALECLARHTGGTPFKEEEINQLLKLMKSVTEVNGKNSH